MKAIKKSTLLELARMTRKYARTGKVDPPTARSEAAKDLAKDIRAWFFADDHGFVLSCNR